MKINIRYILIASAVILSILNIGSIVFIITMMNVTLPSLPSLSLQSPKGIFNVLWTIFLLATLAQIAFMFFVKKNTEDTVVFGLMAGIGLFTLPLIIEPLLEQ